MMTQASTEKNTVLKRIAAIIDRVMESESIYQELDRNELVETFSKILDRVSPQILLPLNDEKLKKRVERVMVTELLWTTPNDLTPEEIEIFNAVVEGR
ncbi:MAG: hypothetical protein F6K40_05615 [Okeania sp. SIO3I5]|uniref:hypothetical protein n=1 Tax=Okeania sp. SIO3I5 TaxID=2607805 RepID=UPI0013BC7377|nr:hypothetical protein [Okeania sp. SIO3I5]NEQ35789.1 hypothetical protein [Okeania sp. SIO3I5]